jgi:hypothetical protein
LRSNALIAGIALLLMALLAGITYGYFHTTLVVAGNSGATFQNLKSSTGFFKAELTGWIIILLLDGLVSWALYRFFRHSHRPMAMLSSVLRVFYTVFLGIAIYELSDVLRAVQQVLPAEELGSQLSRIENGLRAFDHIWSLGLIVFGLHLMLLGYLALQALYVPTLWGVLLIISGLCYTAVHVSFILFPAAADALTTVESILGLPMAVGEISFAMWLVWKGGRNGI